MSDIHYPILEAGQPDPENGAFIRISERGSGWGMFVWAYSSVEWHECPQLAGTLPARRPERVMLFQEWVENLTHGVSADQLQAAVARAAAVLDAEKAALGSAPELSDGWLPWRWNPSTKQLETERLLPDCSIARVHCQGANWKFYVDGQWETYPTPDEAFAAAERRAVALAR